MLAGAVLSTITCVLAIIFNTLLCPLILWKSGKNIGNYRYLLFLYTLTATLYATVHCIAIPTFFVSEKGLAYFTQRTIESKTIGTILVFADIILYSSIIFIICVCFVYRLCVIAYPNILLMFQSKCSVGLLIVFSILLQGLLNAPCVLFMTPTQESDILFEPELLEYSGFSSSDLGWVGGPIYINGHLRYEIAAVMLEWSIFVVFCTTLISYCVYSIMKSLRASIKLLASRSNMTQQKRLLTLLLLQTLFPMVFTFTPPLICFVLAVFSVSPGRWTLPLGAITSLSGVIDPILIFCLIKDYRKAVKQWFRPTKSTPSVSQRVDQPRRSDNG